MIFRARASPLHATRASVACAWCAALIGAALTVRHPLVLMALLVTMFAVAAGARVLYYVGLTGLRIGLPIAVLFVLINPFVSRNGVTVIARLGEIPVFGKIDLTWEATVYGALLGLRALVVILAFAVYATAVNPDQVLRLFRRVGFRSALTATLATRMVSVLGGDARRMSDGLACRGTRPPGRLAIVRAVANGALDRATDVAASLEVRGYGAALRAPRSRRSWSRHDFAFAASAVALIALTIFAAFADVGRFEAYPRLDMAGGLAPLILGILVGLCALAPFADRRGIA